MSRSKRAAQRPVLGVRFYKNAGGKEPVREWLKAQTDDVKKEIGADILRVQWRWPVGRPLVDGFGEGLYEVRTSLDGEKYRLLFTIVDGEMVLLHGIHKKSRATPSSDVELARDRQKDVVG
jgi:phage-related protein